MTALISDKDKKQLDLRITQAATGHLDWHWFLADLHRISGGAKVHMSTIDTKANLPLDMIQHGFDPDFLASHRAYYGAMNLWAIRSNNVPIGQVVSTRNLAADSELFATEFYHDWVKPQGDVIGGGSANLATDGRRRFAIGGVVRKVDRETLEPRWLGILNYLLPRLSQALSIKKTLGDQSLRQQMGSEGMLTDTAACFLLSANCTVMSANPKAENLITNGDVVRCNHLARLRFSSDHVNQKLASAMFGFFNSDSVFSPPFFSTSGNGNAAYICRTIKLRFQDHLPAPFPFANNTSDFILLLMDPITRR